MKKWSSVIFLQVQLKYQPKGRPKSTSSEDDGPKGRVHLHIVSLHSHSVHSEHRLLSILSSQGGISRASFPTAFLTFRTLLIFHTLLIFRTFSRIPHFTSHITHFPPYSSIFLIFRTFLIFRAFPTFYFHSFSHANFLDSRTFFCIQQSLFSPEVSSVLQVLQTLHPYALSQQLISYSNKSWLKVFNNIISTL
jgi:hypothetical protein